MQHVFNIEKSAHNAQFWSSLDILRSRGRLFKVNGGGVGLGVWGLRVHGAGISDVQVFWGLGLLGLGFRVECSGFFGVEGLGFRF